MSTKLKRIKERFVETMQEVSNLTGTPVEDISRNMYVRVTVDSGIEGRLNKEELNLIGGFKEAKSLHIKPSRSISPKVLIFDLETTPLVTYTWGLFDQNIGLNQVLEKTTILSWAAKWLGSDKIMYADVRNEKNPRNDKSIVKKLRDLIDEADYLVAHNLNKFDKKVLNYRIVKNKIQKPSSTKNLDTLVIAKRHFKADSYKLEHLTNELCTSHKKSTHGKFPGFTMWDQCLKGNKEAFKELEDYNIKDITSLEELFKILLPWENARLFEAFQDAHAACTCGSTQFQKKGFVTTAKFRYDRHVCKKCGAEYRGERHKK
jgi:uncharacterized protein YprB with RNaseH-like and TPR domain